MRWPALSMLMMLALLPGARAQERVSLDTPNRVTYFLIDASGSMAEELEGSVPTISVGEQAEAEVSNIKARIAVGNPDALVSRTYFRAENRDLCHHPVRIAPPTPIVSNVLQKRSYGNDFTPLGSVLKAAVKAIGDQPADIYLITDGMQTSDCGPDICEIASQILPIPNVNVTPIVIGAPEGELGLLSCIDTAESRQTQAVYLDANENKQLENSVERESTWVDHPWVQSVFQFFEHWWWLIGIVFLACSAIGIGRRESARAQLFEDGIEDAKSLQKLIRENDGEAPSELRLLVARVKSRALDWQGTKHPTKFREIDAAKVEAVRIDRLYSGTEWWRVPLSYPIGSLGGLVLACLAFLPDEVFGVRLENAKDVAWGVLDSDFATAFAVTWIAIVFFAGTQHQRRREATHQFNLATREAERIAEIELSEAVRLALVKYQQAVLKAESIVKDVVDYADKAGGEQLSNQLHDDAILVANRLRDIVIGVKLNSLDKLEQISHATQRLSGLVDSSFLQPSVDLKALILRLERIGATSPNDERWRNLRLYIAQGIPDLIYAAISELAAEFRRP